MPKRKPAETRRQRTPEWDILLHLASHGRLTIADLRRHYPRKNAVLDHQLEQLRDSGVVWFADEQWQADDKVGSLLVLPPAADIMHEGLQAAPEAKLRLAQFIATQDLVKYNDVIFLDTGSTLTNAALQLAFLARMRDVDVVTNNPFLLGLSLKHVRSLHFIGGHVRLDGRVILPESIDLAQFIPGGKERFSRSFIGVYGVIAEQGILCEQDVLLTKKRAMELAQEEIFIPIDDRKLGASPAGIGEVLMTFDEMRDLDAQVTILVTRPANPPEIWSAEFEKLEQRNDACKIVEVKL